MYHGYSSAVKKPNNVKTVTCSYALKFKLTKRTLLVFFFSIGCLVKSKTMANATCYYPNGSIAPEATPCHPPATSDLVSACCSNSHLCLDNGLCLPQNGPERFGRGSCTDRTWQSTECSQYCPDGNTHLFGKVWIWVQNSPSYLLHLHADISVLQSTPMVGLRYIQ